jgi:hypothetical protein
MFSGRNHIFFRFRLTNIQKNVEWFMRWQRFPFCNEDIFAWTGSRLSGKWVEGVGTGTEVLSGLKL